MRAIGSLNIILVALLLSAPCAFAAKQDIRGVTLGMTRDQSTKVIKSSGANCNEVMSKTECYIGDGQDRSFMEIRLNPDNVVWAIDYIFIFHMPANKMKEYLVKEYDLKSLPGGEYAIGNNIGVGMEFNGSKGRFFMMRSDLEKGSPSNAQAPLPKF